MEIVGKMYVKVKKWNDKWLYSTSVADEGEQRYAYLNVDITKNARAKIKELGIKPSETGTIEIYVTWGWLKSYNGNFIIVIHDLEKVEETDIKKGLKGNEKTVDTTELSPF